MQGCKPVNTGCIVTLETWADVDVTRITQGLTGCGIVIASEVTSVPCGNNGKLRCYWRLAKIDWSAGSCVKLGQYSTEVLFDIIRWSQVKMRNCRLCVVGYCPSRIFICFTGAYLVDEGIERFAVQIIPSKFNVDNWVIVSFDYCCLLFSCVIIIPLLTGWITRIIIQSLLLRIRMHHYYFVRRPW